MAVRTRAFVRGVNLLQAETLLYKVPTNRVMLLKGIDLVNTSATATQVTLYLKPAGGASRQIAVVPLSGSASIHLAGFRVGHEDDELRASVWHGQVVHMWAYGALLDGDPA